MLSTIDILIQAPSSVMNDNKAKHLVLNLKIALIDQLKRALFIFFVEKDYTRFDPHVGENSCQIRVCQILDLLDKQQITFSMDLYHQRIRQLEKLTLNINLVLESLKKHVVIKRYHKGQAFIKSTLKDFLETNKCYCDLFEHEIFLVHTFLLSHYKKVNGIGDTCIDLVRLQDELGLSKTLAEKLVHRYQVRLSEWSTEFVRKCLNSSPKLKNFRSILDKLEYRDDDFRRVLPLFLMTKILINYLLISKKTILVVTERRHGIHFIDHIYMIFKPDNISSTFVLFDINLNCDELILNTPCFVVYGTVVYQSYCNPESDISYVKRFSQLGILDIIMANMAIHPQYSGNRLLKYKSNPYKLLSDEAEDIVEIHDIMHKFNKKIEVATKYGCSKENIDLFFIRHIICDTPINQMKANIKSKYCKE
ncbi:MAG: hypothetical protein K0R14_1506 [Burkholderiales bacterium]|jgi:hypothetical protein|nr:hypothetical protein [Burkholderiales bacterium]